VLRVVKNGMRLIPLSGKLVILLYLLNTAHRPANWIINHLLWNSNTFIYDLHFGLFFIFNKHAILFIVFFQFELNPTDQVLRRDLQLNFVNHILYYLLCILSIRLYTYTLSMFNRNINSLLIYTIHSSFRINHLL